MKDVDPSDTLDFKAEAKPRAKEALAIGVQALAELQDKLYAQDKWAVLLIFKPWTPPAKMAPSSMLCRVSIHRVARFIPSNRLLPRTSIMIISGAALKSLPNRGHIGIFNRSYYEETLVVRVHPEFLAKQRIPPALVTKRIWKERFQDIRCFERYLTRNGIIVIKFFLHVSKKEQKRRFLERAGEPEKNWKFSGSDMAERDHWDEYQDAYEDMIRNTATKHSPWYVVPADNKWFTRVVVGAAVVDTLASLDLAYPQVDKPKLEEIASAKKALLKSK